MLVYLIVAMLALWITLGALAILACVCGGRAEAASALCDSQLRESRRLTQQAKLHQGRNTLTVPLSCRPSAGPLSCSSPRRWQHEWRVPEGRKHAPRR